MVPWCRLCRNMPTYNLGRGRGSGDAPPPPCIGEHIPDGIPFNGEGVWACIPKMGTEVHDPLLAVAERRVHKHVGTTLRGRCTLDASNLG